MTNEELQKEIEELRRELAEIKIWIEQRKTQQISFPLDRTSKTIIANT